MVTNGARCCVQVCALGSVVITLGQVQKLDGTGQHSRASVNGYTETLMVLRY